MKIEKRNVGVGLATLCGAAALTGVAFAGNTHGTPPGQSHAKAHAKGSASASASTAAGVKSSAVTNTTGHNTNAAASSNRTKLYGNGQTAGQIAMKNGAGASTNLYGPGNSQPHKAVLCPGSKHAVDVHALKAHGGSAPCGGTSGGTSSSGSTSTGTSGQVAGATASGTKTGSSGSAGNGNGVLGATHGPSGSVKGAARPAKPVFGAANFTG
jgi:hypothetical protein